MSSNLQQIAEALATGEKRSADLVENALRSADDGVFVLKLEDDARRSAAAADRARANGDLRPFLGVPITIKDNVDLAGIPTTAGSLLLSDVPPAWEDAPLVRKLKDAGFVVVGRTNMTEFAFSGLGINPHFGTPANPAFSETHIPGGSSSGAAVSVAAGLVPVAIGTDTGGSVRIPAAMCGLVGFKPTAFQIDARGVLPLSASLDTVGLIARSVEDCSAAFELLRQSERAAPQESSTRLGFVENYVWDDADPVVRERVEQALDALETAGFSVEPVRIPALEGIADAMKAGTFSTAEAYQWHRAYLEGGRTSEYDPRVVSRIASGANVDDAAYALLHAWRADFIKAFDAAAHGFAALLWPTVPIVAPRLDDLREEAAYWRANALALRNSSIVNLADGCAISLPCPGAPPIGLTLAAPNGADDALLDIAMAVEATLALH